MAPVKIKKSSAYNLRTRKTEASPLQPATETDESETKRVTRSSTSSASTSTNSSSSVEPEIPIPPEPISASVSDDAAKKKKRQLDSSTEVKEGVSQPRKILKKVVGSFASLNGSSKLKKRRKKRRTESRFLIEPFDIEAIEGERKTKYGQTQYLIRWAGYKNYLSWETTLNMDKPAKDKAMRLCCEFKGIFQEKDEDHDTSPPEDTISPPGGNHLPISWNMIPSRILDVRHVTPNGKQIFLVKWRGVEFFPCWVSAEKLFLENASHLIVKFYSEKFGEIQVPKRV